jgi:hypothetical protein
MFEQSDLKNGRILVVQDDFVEELKIVLDVNPGASAAKMNLTEQTIAILQGSDIGAAIFDHNLDHASSAAIADALATLGIPFTFADTDDMLALPERLITYSMMESSPELQMIAHQMLGPPTYH